MKPKVVGIPEDRGLPVAERNRCRVLTFTASKQLIRRCRRAQR